MLLKIIRISFLTCMLSLFSNPSFCGAEENQNNSAVNTILEILKAHNLDVAKIRENHQTWLENQPKDSDEVSKHYVGLMAEIFSNENFLNAILSEILNEKSDSKIKSLTLENKENLMKFCVTYHKPTGEIAESIQEGFNPLTSSAAAYIDYTGKNSWLVTFNHGNGNHNHNYSYYHISQTGEKYTVRLILETITRESHFNPQNKILTTISKGGTIFSDYSESKYKLSNGKFQIISSEVSLRGDQEKSWAYMQHQKDQKN